MISLLESRAQVSLWVDQNVYSTEIEEGQLYQIKINEVFNIQVDSSKDQKGSLELKLTPEKNYTSFLQAANVSRNRTDKNEVKSSVKDQYQFSLMGVIGKTNGKLFSISAQKNILLDGKKISIALTGLVNNKSVINNVILSTRIAQLNIQIIAKANIKRDSAKLTNEKKDKNAANNKNEEQKVTILPTISKADKKRILQLYLREILGAINK